MLSIRLLFSILLLFTLSACAAAVVGGVASGGYMATQERSVGRGIDDIGLDAEITHKFLQSDVNTLLPLVNVNVVEGRVLLTGNVEKQATARRAVALSWQVEGVREVINEIQIGGNRELSDSANDQWINAQLDSSLLFTKGVQSVNYNTRVINGVVYILGIAQDRAETDRVLHVARTIKGVKEVISHIRLKNDPNRGVL